MGLKRCKATRAERASLCQGRAVGGIKHDYCKIRKSKDPDHKPKPKPDPYEADIRSALKHMQANSLIAREGRCQPSMPKISFQTRKVIAGEVV